MTNTRFGILCALAGFAILSLAAVLFHSQVQLRGENQSLVERLGQLPLLSRENQRLSNLVMQAKLASASTEARLQDLLPIQAEANRLRLENQKLLRESDSRMAASVSNQVRELTALRNDIGELSDVISTLRDEVQQLQTEAPIPSSPPEQPTVQTPPRVENQPISIRIIRVRPSTFEEKLTRAVNGLAGESFQDLFGRFLQSNGVDLTNIAGLVYDGRQGRIVVRAPEAILDQIEKLTVILEAEP